MTCISDSFRGGPPLQLTRTDTERGIALGHRGIRKHRHRSLDGVTPTAIFEAVERSALAPLPVRPFETGRYSVGTVAPDCHVKAGKAFYTVPS